MYMSNSYSRRRALCSNVDRKSTRLNSSHLVISYAVFCLKKIALLLCACREGAVHLGLLRESPGWLSTSHAITVAGLIIFFFIAAAPPESYPLPLPAPFPI